MDGFRKVLAARAAFVAVFLAALWIPLLGTLGGSDAVLRGEKRLAAPWPSLGTGYREFPGAFERAFSDRFGFRSEMGAAYRWLVYHLGLMGSGRGGVVEGKEGWRFYASGRLDDTLEVASGGLRLSEEELASAADRLLAWQRWFEERGARFYYLSLPNKASVYPQYLPDRIKPSLVGTRTDQLLRRLKSRGVNVLAPYEALRAAGESDDRLYYRWDTHWTNLGCLVAYRAIAPAFSGSYWIRWERFAVAEGRRRFGDLQGFVGLPGAFEDHDPKVDWAGPAKPEGLPKALVFHDSFMLSLARFLELSFSELELVPADRPSAEAFAGSGAEVVIFEQVERFAHALPELPLPE